MTNEERDIITRFIERVGGAQAGAGFGSVPGTAPALAPVDREADALIGELFARYPEARYRLTQTAFVQEHALAAAQNRIKQLEYELQQAQAALQQAQTQPRQGGGFLSGLFGGGSAPARPPAPPPAWNQGGAQPYQGAPFAQGGPPPQYAPGYQPGMFQRQGSGFLGSALTTAAGVAGGMVAGNALMNLFSGHRSAGADLAGGVPAMTPVESSPWGNAAPGGDQGADQGYIDQASWTTPDAPADPGYAADQSSWGGGGDQASWDPSGGDQSSWDSGGFDDNNA